MQKSNVQLLKTMKLKRVLIQSQNVLPKMKTIVDGSYDKDNGTLTLNRKNGENNITVQFNFNFGTF